jgi:hypothetical protein
VLGVPFAGLVEKYSKGLFRIFYKAVRYKRSAFFVETTEIGMSEKTNIKQR